MIDSSNTELKNLNNNAVDAEFSESSVKLTMLHDLFDKYMPGNDKLYDFENIVEDSSTMMQYIDRFLEDVVVGAKYDRCKQRALTPEVSIARTQQMGGAVLYDNTITSVTMTPDSNFDLTAINGKIWGFNNIWNYDITDHNIATFNIQPGNTHETNYVKSKPVAEAEKEYRENSELTKLSSIFARNENDFYSSWYLLMNGLERLNQTVAMPFTKLFLYGMQYSDLKVASNVRSRILNDKVSGNLNSVVGITNQPELEEQYLPYDQQYTYDSTAPPGNYRIDVQMVPLGWAAANQSKYDDLVPYATGPIAKYLKGDKNVRVIPIIGGRVPILYILAHLYYPWFCFKGDQTVTTYTANTATGGEDIKEEEITVISNAAALELGRLSAFTRGNIPTVVLESVLLVDVTDKNKVLENDILQMDVLNLQMARADLEPANLMTALHDGIARFHGSWNTALDYMSKVYRSTTDMLSGLKQALWLTCRYNRAGYVNSFFVSQNLTRAVFSETMTWTIYSDGDYRKLCSNMHQFGDGTYIPLSDTSVNWYQRESPAAIGTLLDCAPRFRLAVASGAIVSTKDVDDIGRLIRPNIGLAALDNTWDDLIYTGRLYMHALHYLQSMIYNNSGLSLASSIKMDRYNCSAYDELRSPLLTWALGWNTGNDVDGMAAKKVLTTYNNSIYALYGRDELTLSPLLSIDKCILTLFGCTFPQVPKQLSNLVSGYNLKTIMHYTYGVSAVLTDKMSEFDYSALIHKYFGFRLGSISRPKINVVKNALTLWNEAQAQFFGIAFNRPKIFRSQNYQTTATTEFECISTLVGRMQNVKAAALLLHFKKGDGSKDWWLPYLQTDTEHVYDRWELANEARSELYMILGGDISYGVETHFAVSNGNLDVPLPFNFVRTGKLQSRIGVMNKVFNKDKKQTKF